MWAPTICNTPGCVTKIPQGQGRCQACRAQADQARRPDGNPYSTHGHQTFRGVVLRRDPICVICDIRPATVADHYPRTREELIQLGLNPNDPQYGRGLCTSCHNTHTAKTSPGGWNARQNQGG